MRRYSVQGDINDLIDTLTAIRDSHERFDTNEDATFDDRTIGAFGQEMGGGTKYDAGKPDWSLMPFEALEPVVRVLEHGARKYGPENWRDLDDAERRYWNAAMRHMLAHMQGDTHDEDSGLPHLAHAVCSLLFVLALEFEHD